MIDIEGADKQVKQIDNLLSSVKSLLRKHWFFLILIFLGFMTYLIVTMPDDETIPQTEQVVPADDSTDDSDSTSQQ